MIYLLTRLDEVGYDEFDGWVIRAKSEEEARKLANECCGNEGEMWNDKDMVACILVEPDGDADVILSSFNAG